MDGSDSIDHGGEKVVLANHARFFHNETEAFGGALGPKLFCNSFITCTLMNRKCICIKAKHACRTGIDRFRVSEHGVWSVNTLLSSSPTAISVPRPKTGGRFGQISFVTRSLEVNDVAH